MATKDSLGDRMKEYEGVSRYKLTRRMPVVIRIDGKSFHTFTRGFNKPYDIVLSDTMGRTMKYLCENIQGCVFGYTQSDEITLILVDYEKLYTSAWFDNTVQKMCSIAASMATMAFNKFFGEEVGKFSSKVSDPQWYDYYGLHRLDGGIDQERIAKLNVTYRKAYDRGAMFDARVFNVPKEDVTNCVLWRQQDATRNSIEMLGRAFFTHKQLFKKNCSDIQDMLMTWHNVNWNDVDTRFKRGFACIRKETEVSVPDTSTASPTATAPCGKTTRRVWVLDMEMPIITQDRDYVDKLVFIGE